MIVFFLETFVRSQRRCRECELLDQGICTVEPEDNCRCLSNYEGYFCRIPSVTTTDPSLRSSQITHWIIIIAVISSIAGLLLIIAVFMCIVRIIPKCFKTTAK